MKIFLFGALLAVASVVVAEDAPVDSVIKLTAEQAKTCEDEGGCVVITQEGLSEMLRKHAKKALVECRNIL